MERYSANNSGIEPATYNIGVLGTLDKDLSAYYGGMTIDHRSDPGGNHMTILRGLMVDQSALIGVLNSLHDTGYQILFVECREASALCHLPDLLNDEVEH
jgi:hypothetical protein